MKRLLLAVAAILVAGATASCSLSELLSPCPRDLVCVDGTAQFFSVEGGFWAVSGDDSVTYDPAGGLPTDFRTSGLRVHLRARMRPDLYSIHMAGPVVDIVSIRKLN